MQRGLDACRTNLRDAEEAAAERRSRDAPASGRFAAQT